MSVVGPTLTFREICFCAAAGGIADIGPRPRCKLTRAKKSAACNYATRGRRGYGRPRYLVRHRVSESPVPLSRASFCVHSLRRDAVRGSHVTITVHCRRLCLRGAVDRTARVRDQRAHTTSVVVLLSVRIRLGRPRRDARHHSDEAAKAHMDEHGKK
jgi:hypothetical protein